MIMIIIIILIILILLMITNDTNSVCINSVSINMHIISTSIIISMIHTERGARAQARRGVCVCESVCVWLRESVCLCVCVRLRGVYRPSGSL